MIEIAIKIHGRKQVLEFKTALEAAEVIRMLTALDQQPAASQAPKDELYLTPAPSLHPSLGLASQDTPTVNPTTFVPMTVRNVLEHLRGTRTGRFLKLLASFEKFGATDYEIKSKLQEQGWLVNLAGFGAALTRVCETQGIKANQIMIRRKRAIGNGRTIYHYSVPPNVGSYIRSIPDFEVDKDFGAVVDDPESNPATKAPKRRGPKARGAPLRDKVIACLRESPKTMQEVITAVGSKRSTIASLFYVHNRGEFVKVSDERPTKWAVSDDLPAILKTSEGDGKR